MLPSDLNPPSQIVVLDAGGQYCHLIARKVRELGVYAAVRLSETPAAELAQARGIIISGGPSSVYDPASPTVDPAIFTLGRPVMGICYGQQIMAHALGGTVRRGDKGEYGLAALELEESSDPLFSGLSGAQQVWMNHRDAVAALPAGFHVTGRTATCAIAAIAAPERQFYGVQFHPAVVHTTRGVDYLSNFVFRVCEAEVAQVFVPARGVHDLRMKLDAVEFARGGGDGGHGAGVGAAHDGEAFGQRADRVAVAHPDLLCAGEAIE